MRNVTVQILGQNLVVASDSDEDWIRSVARTVDQRMREMREAGKIVSLTNVAIVTALNFADELARLQREHRELLDQIDALSKRLSASIGEP